jgi:hypothetical protein
VTDHAQAHLSHALSKLVHVGPARAAVTLDTGRDGHGDAASYRRGHISSGGDAARAHALLLFWRLCHGSGPRLGLRCMQQSLELAHLLLQAGDGRCRRQRGGAGVDDTCASLMPLSPSKHARRRGTTPPSGA